MTGHYSKYKQITILLEPQNIFDLIMFEAEEFDIFVSRQAILGDVCNVCPSLRICAEPLPEEMLPTLHYIENYTAQCTTLILLNVLSTQHSIKCT